LIEIGWQIALLDYDPQTAGIVLGSSG